MSSEEANVTEAPISADDNEQSLAYAWSVTAILMIAYTFSFLDREILYLLVEPIKAAFDLTEFEMGLLMGPAFGIFYTVMGVPLGWAADKFNRTHIITIGVSAWSALTAACGLAGSFIQLFIARIGVGVGEATLTPSAVSLISDYFPKNKLPFAMSIYSLGVFVGSGLAMMGGAYVLSLIEGQVFNWPIVGELDYWQAAFIMVGAPGLLLAALIFCLKEPKRKEMAKDESGKDKAASMKEAFKYIWTNKKLFLNFFVGGSIIATIGYHTAWYPELFVRTWGWTKLEAGQAIGMSSIFGGTAGLVLGGMYMSRMTDQGKKHIALSLALASALCIGLPTIFMPLMPNGMLAAGLMIASKFFVGIPLITGTTAIRMSVPNQMRGQFTAIYFVFVGLFATSLGPVIPGFFTTYVFNENLEMLKYSLAISAALVVPIGTFLIWNARKEYIKVVYADEE
ncbi:spinster family MFS transporter [Pseudemcibacter aquimaris]|uniref:spinster family MFS transporter n=1 Tax=Pseudemcibacter aquimaris TaxID=2857064 RepID=UPI002011C3D6|nr:MFS transporter [Pseudemcibacter aquimaris]MCC3860202.1 MFS transporter [Pseudemcibacter aquimaris]WDU57527.1 MFS transporter [Pseudemcibacter aquimaris]